MIPTNLDECMEALKEELSPEDQMKFCKISEDDLSRYHMGLGRWIRNTWGLWTGGPLNEHMKSLGFIHPDDMSSSIIKEFWNRMNDKPSCIEQDVQYYKKYWEKAQETVV